MYRIISIPLTFILGFLINSASGQPIDGKIIQTNEAAVFQSAELDILQTQTREMEISSSISLSQAVQEKLERESCKNTGAK